MLHCVNNVCINTTVHRDVDAASSIRDVLLHQMRWGFSWHLSPQSGLFTEQSCKLHAHSHVQSDAAESASFCVALEPLVQEVEIICDHVITRFPYHVRPL